jgi:hypothetical protein
MTTRGEDVPEATGRAADPVHDGTVSPERPAQTEDAGSSRQHATLAIQHDSAITEAIRSLEVRWILPGPLDPMVARWFARLPPR